MQQPLSVELIPIARLRSTHATGTDSFRSDVSFVPVSGSEIPLPMSILPPQMASSPSGTSSGRSDLPSSHSSHCQYNFKDVPVRCFWASCVCDASRWRNIIASLEFRFRHQRDEHPVARVGATGGLSALPPSKGAARKRSGSTQQMLGAATELVGKENTVATWQLKQGHDWGGDARSARGWGSTQTHIVQVRFPSHLSLSFTVLTRSSLAHAELLTCARSPGLVPHLIYLFHLFLLYILDKDYHAFIRRHRLTI